MTSTTIFVSLRRMSPAFVDTRVYSCLSSFPSARRLHAYSSDVKSFTEGPNKGYKPNPLFENRNPRNLEQMGLARKRQGWVLQSPRKDFYHRVVLQRTNRNTSGHIEHFSGKEVVSASTVEWAVKEGLYSLVDVSAAENIGRILGQRCMECGITSVFYDEEEDHATSEKVQAFLNGLRESGLRLEEVDVKNPEFVAGIDYSCEHRVGEKKKWKDDYQPL